MYPDARNRWAHPELEAEGLEPWSVGAGVDRRGRAGLTHYVDITDAVDRKIEALMCHKSQLPDPEATDEMVRGWTSMIAASGGSARRALRRSRAIGDHRNERSRR